ncbi:MAG: sugar phosphate isomerase/epimerase family protein [Burkholderiales bacterium]
MKLSLSARVGEKFSNKREAAMSFEQFADIAVLSGYHAVCMRASLLGIHTPSVEVAAKAKVLRDKGLAVSMVTGDFAIPENTNDGPAALRNIGPYLDLAAALDCDILRVALRHEEDIAWAQRAADAARERGIRLAHQCHTRSLFERVDETLSVLARINRPNFGLTYEPANLEACGEDYGPATIRRLAPHIINVYLQNQRLDPQGASVLRTWCRGDVRFEQIPLWDMRGIDFAAIFGALQSAGYDGYVTVHQAGLNTPQVDALESARYLHSVGHMETRQ